MLYDLMKQLMLGGELSFGDGKITFMGQRLQLVNSSFFAYRLKYAKDFWKEAQLQYSAMKDANIKGWFEPVRKEKGLKGDELLKWAINYFELAGWGRISIEFSQISKGRVKVKIDNSAFALSYLNSFGKCNHPVCHLTRGGICGGGNFIANRDDLEMIETRCKAQGYPHCELIIKPIKEFTADEISKYGKQISPKGGKRRK